MDIQDYLRQQNREQREILTKNEETIKLLKRENYKVKQSIYEKLAKVQKIGHSDDIHKDIKMLDIIDNLVDDLYYNIQEELEQDLEREYKRELVDLPKSN